MTKKENDTSQQMPRICLNMIVKNESKIIRRCLEAMVGQIDCAVICDTGSTDDTKEIIRTFCAAHDIQCEIPETTFENFEQARNVALDAARASDLAFDYILLCDADMVLETLDPDWRNTLSADYYRVEQYNEAIRYQNVRVVRRDIDCRYVGVTHEYLDCPGTLGTMTGLRYFDTASGANRVEKYERDIRLLTEALDGDLADDLRARYTFYLARSYSDTDQYERAITAFRARIEMGGWEEECYSSLYAIGQQYQRMIPQDGAEAEMRMVGAFVDAHAARPNRAEPLVELATHYRNKEMYETAYMFARRACDLPADADGDILFVRYAMYQIRRWDELAVAAYWIGRYEEAIAACSMALHAAGLSDDARARITENQALSAAKLA